MAGLQLRGRAGRRDAPVIEQDDVVEDWREAITAIARRSHEAFQRHRWTLDRVTDISIGPNGIKHFEQSLQAVASTGLPVRERLHLISLVDEFVFGYSLRETLDFGGEVGDEQWPAGTLELFERELQSGAHPHTGSLIAELQAADVAEGTRHAMQIISDPARFEAGLVSATRRDRSGDAGRGRLTAERRRRYLGLALDLWNLHRDLVDEAPRPRLTGLQGVDNRVIACVGMGASVTVGRGVAAADMPTLQADAQMQPLAAHLQAVLAALD